MIENKTLGIIAAFILLTSGLIGSVAYNVYDTGEELTCRANKPIGWEIDSVDEINGVKIYSAHCPYATKDHVYAKCSSFRSTNSYQNYGCNEVLVVEHETEVESKTNNVWGKSFKCKQGVPCVEI